MKHRSSILLGLFVAFLVTIIVMRSFEVGDAFFEFFGLVPGKDKLGHFVLMGILAFLAVVSVVPMLAWARGRSTAAVLAVVFAIIAAEECSQYFIASRSFSLGDLASDAAGVVVFGFAAHLWVSRRAADDRVGLAGSIGED